MRQIKFRAWFIHEKEYRTWEDILSHRYNERWFIDNTDKEYINCIFTDDTIILEQYTGLKDKNGAEIYEGDIVRVLYTDWPSKSDGDSRTLEQYKKDISNNGVIEKYKHGYFVNFGLDRFREVCRGMIDPGKHGEIEIIGNIHETPELMENK